jgi:hypothetical protein
MNMNNRLGFGKVLGNHLGLAVAIGWLMVGCTVSSTSPVSDLDQSNPPPDFWLGEWEVETILGEAPDPPARITLARSSQGNLTFSLQQGDVSESGEASLGTVGGLDIASFPSSSGFWTLLSCVEAPAGDRLILKSLNNAAVAQDILQGVVAGDVKQFGSQSDDVVELTAPQAELRAYLSGRADLFTEEFLVLQRPPQPPQQ